MRFYISYTNRRGTTYGAGTSAGNATHVRGWNAGVKAVPRDDNGKDVFDVYMTSGSHANGPDVLLGTVRDTPDGPVFEPNMEASHLHSQYVFPFAR
jgi:hypothetical protein